MLPGQAVHPSPGFRFARPPSPRGEGTGNAALYLRKKSGEGATASPPDGERVAERSPSRVGEQGKSAGESEELRKRRKPPANLLLEAYRPIEGVVDEMVNAAGNPRPVWKNFIASLEAMGSEELQKRFARADQYLRDAGVYYRVYDRAGANEREWPLAHVPLLVDEAEWLASARA